MRSYRFTRRSFLAGVGGAFGLKTLLGNLEAAAAGAAPPPRFLMTHWPVGTIRYNFLPQGSGTSYTTSRIIKPFEDAMLREDMTVLYGLTHSGLNANGGGGHEAGTPFSTTGISSPGTRSNGGEGDDATAGGPSFDQIFLKRVPALQRSGIGYVNAICDARVDSRETSTQCLSYSYTMRSVAANSGGMLNEATPLLPELSPVQLFMNLFAGFMPGGATDGNMDAARRALQARKSVLDYAMSELNEIKLIAPSAEAPKIDAHTDAIRAIETDLADRIANGDFGAPDGCAVPTQPDSSLVGKTGSRNDYGNPGTTTADQDIHESIGNAHAGIIRAAFQCDILRVATFQWSPGTNHVSFSGLYPGSNQIYMHHPLSHRITNRNDVMSAAPSGENGDIVEFLTNVQTWYNEKTAAILNTFKNATDVNGANLLDYTVIPYITEVAETTHSRSPLAAMIFGGKALGMQGGQFMNFESGGGGFGGGRHMNDLWMTVAQAYVGSDPLSAFGEDSFYKQGVGPIDELWLPPA